MDTEEQPFEKKPIRHTPRKASLFFGGISVIRRFGVLIAILVLVIVVGGGYELGRYSVYKQYPQLSKQDEANAILSKLSLLIQLPQNEAPNMATIVDAAAAKQQQPFVADAQNGDVLIVYTNSGMAILYRPGTNKIIAVGPVTGQSNTISQGSSTPIPPAVAASSTSKKSSTNASTTPSK